LTRDQNTEHVFELLDWTLAAVQADGHARPDVETPGRKTADRHRAMVEAVLVRLYQHHGRNDSLEAIAGMVDTSPFHLARVFRRLTGRTIHDYRNQIRLCRALELLESQAPEGRGRADKTGALSPRRRHLPVDLTALALELGFASHSHFTTAFGKAFGVPPSEIGRRRIQELLKLARF
jgi:AraC family transcriptional regulator